MHSSHEDTKNIDMFKKLWKNMEMKSATVRFGFFVKWHINLLRLFNAKAILLEEQ